MRRPLPASLLGCLVLSASAAAAHDVAVGDIHVTQGVQHADPLFWAPLVAERSTAVRVHVRCLSGNPGPVHGKLKVFVGSQEVTPAGGVDDVNAQFPNANGQFVPTCGRFVDVFPYEEDMLTFELPAPNGIVPSGGAVQSSDVAFEVELFSQGDTDPTNNVGTVGGLTVVRRAPMRLYKVPVAYRPGGGTPATIDPDGNPLPGNVDPDPAFIAPGVGDAMAPAVWPTSDADPQPPGQGTYWDNHMFPPLLSGFTFESDCNGDGLVNDGPGPQPGCPSSSLPAILRSSFPLYVHEFDALLARLMAMRFLLVEHGVGPVPTMSIYGWLADGNLFGASGVALLGGANVGFGTDSPSRGQMTYAHELGHMSADLLHNQPDLGVDEHGWDVGARLQNNPNPMPPGISGRIRPPLLAYYGDVMNRVASPTAERWIDLTSYQAALDHPRLAAALAAPCERVRCHELETIVVQAVPGWDDGGRRSLAARVVTYPWYTPPLSKASRPNVKVTLVAREPGVADPKTYQVAVEARGIADSLEAGDRELDTAPFAVPLAVPRGTRLERVRIEGIAEDRFSLELSPSAPPPAVTVTRPKPGATLAGGAVELSWAGQHQDPKAELSYQVAYSPDEGRSFVPVAVDVRGTKLVLDAATLPRTEPGRGLLRVFANDGLGTGHADVKGLSVDR